MFRGVDLIGDISEGTCRGGGSADRTYVIPARDTKGGGVVAVSAVLKDGIATSVQLDSVDEIAGRVIAFNARAAAGC